MITTQADIDMTDEEYELGCLREEAERLCEENAALRAERDELNRRLAFCHKQVADKGIDSAKLREENAALQADAERYRWLRDCAPPSLCVQAWTRITPYGVPQPDSSVRGRELDAAIDAARAKP